MSLIENLGRKALSADSGGRVLSIAALIAFFSFFLIIKAKTTEAILPKNSDSYFENAAKSLDISRELKAATFEQKGVASWYGKKFHNRRTANGERYNMFSLTAAHKKLPFNSIVRVKNLRNGKNILVRINDRGPYVKRRIIDLSYEAAQAIDLRGLAKVEIEGFYPNKVKKDSAEKYFYGYSYDKALACLPGKVLSMADSAKTFDEAIEKYQSFLNLSLAAETAYLFVPASGVGRKENPKKINYYIGFVKTVMPDIASKE